jgi:hypothetical protein
MHGQRCSVPSSGHWDDILDTEAKLEKFILYRFRRGGRRNALDNYSARFGSVMFDKIKENFMLFQEGLQVEVSSVC